MTDQPALFDASRTSPTPCPVPGCGAIRFPDQTRTPTCHVDRERAINGYITRPKTCLNMPQPDSEQIPF